MMAGQAPKGHPPGTECEVLDFVLPSDRVSKLWNSLSRDENHHVKFHVFRRGAGYELALKGGRRQGAMMPLDSFLGKADTLS